MRQAEADMIRKLIEWLKGKFKPTEEPEYASEPDYPDYDDCANPWVCIATVDDY
jgi:hypothetical protein